MSHHHRRQCEEPQPVETIPVEKSVFPLLEQNDIAVLTMMKPLFSSNGQKIIDIFITLGSGQSQGPFSDITRILSQLTPSGENNKKPDMFPQLLNLLSNPEIQNIVNPTLISSLLSMLANKKEPKENDTELHSN